MEIDINTLRGISTLLVMIAFGGVCIWAYSSKRKEQFEEAANLVFDDEHKHESNTASQTEPGEKSSE